jgi:hypothetical protein
VPGSLPDLVFQQEVLKRLGPGDLASLAGAGRGCAAAVAATALMQWAKRVTRSYPGRQESLLPPLCLKEACSHAACGGNREVLEWLHNTGCPWDSTVCWMATGGGHLDVLQWAREHGCPWDAMTCAYAARSGHLRVLQWAREHGCPWSSLTPANAALGGNLAVLQWAREQNCPWDSYACMYAAIFGQLEVLQWMRENDATGVVFAEDRVRRHAHRPTGVQEEAGGADVAGWTRWSVKKSIQCVRHVCSRYGVGITRSAEHGNDDALQLHRQRCMYT